MLSIWIVIGAVGLLVIATILTVIAAKVTSRPTVKPENLTIDLEQLELTGLDTTGLARQGPHLEFYGIPVRLAVLVVAPMGRGAELPEADQLRVALDSLVPNISKILDLHRPIFRRWPAQLSAHGFPQFFFLNLKLPGNKGLNTPWSSIAGRFQVEDGSLLVGMVFYADKPNGLSQTVVEHEGQWRDALRVRLN